MHFLFFAVGAILIAWGASDIALNILNEGTRPLIVTYGGIANTAIGFILMGLGRCIQLLQNMRGSRPAPMAAATAAKSVAVKEPEPARAEPIIEDTIPETDPVLADFLDSDPGPLEPSRLEPEPELETEPESEPIAEPVTESAENPTPDRGKIVKEGDIRGYPFHLFENGEIELETKSGWHFFSTIEEVQLHIAAEAEIDQESEGK